MDVGALRIYSRTRSLSTPACVEILYWGLHILVREASTY